jgi:hypothetical protein
MDADEIEIMLLVYGAMIMVAVFRCIFTSNAIPHSGSLPDNTTSQEAQAEHPEANEVRLVDLLRTHSKVSPCWLDLIQEVEIVGSTLIFWYPHLRNLQTKISKKIAKSARRILKRMYIMVI